MLQGFIIGNVGADAQVLTKDGRQFATFRVAHNDSYTDATGVRHTSSTWVDCIINGAPDVVQYLKAGTLVCVIGAISLRVYSSPKDRCMKAGMTVHVKSIELLGGKTDPVPSRLYDDTGVMHNVQKHYWCQDFKAGVLLSQRGFKFAVDENGWVNPVANQLQPSEENPDEQNT